MKFIILFSLLVISGGFAFSDAYAQEPEPVITQFTTDKTSYISGETIVISGHIENHFSNYDAIYHINAPNGPTVLQASTTVDGNGDFTANIAADPAIFVACVVPTENLFDDCETYTLEGTYDIIVIHVAGSITASASFDFIIPQTEPQDGSFTLPCSMQEAGDGVSSSSCYGFYTNGIARAEVGINYHSGLFPITNYKVVGYFIDDNGVQGSNITVTLDNINPGESNTIVFTNPNTGFVSEFKMQMLGGTLQTPTPDTIPPVVVVPNNMVIQATSNNPAPVIFSVTATDNIDGNITPVCSPASGFNFAIGTTTVTCTATDVAGNHSTKSFTITRTAPISVPLNMELDKLNYHSTEIVKITITGTPSDVITLLIIDPSDKAKGESKSITLQSDGTATYNLSLSGYVSGAYTAVISKGSSQSSEVFTVDLQTGSTEIKISTTKSNYHPGDSVLVLGDTGANLLLTMSLIDPNGNTIQTKETFSDKNGKISVNSLVIPSNAISGTWEIKSQSGSYFDIAEISVGSVTYDGFTLTVEKGQSIPGLGDTITIKVFGAAQTIKIKIIDEDGKLIEELAFPASNAGEVNQPWIIPKDTESGIYTVTAADAFDSDCVRFNVDTFAVDKNCVPESTPDPEEELEIISLSTKKSQYRTGDTIVITGKVDTSDFSKLMTLQIFNAGNLVDIAQVSVSLDESFSHTIIAEGPLWQASGKYTIRATYGEGDIEETSFVYRYGDSTSDSKCGPGTVYDYQSNACVLDSEPTPQPELDYEVTIVPANGSGAPGCEETSSGCYHPQIQSVAVGGIVIMKNTDTAAHTFTSGNPAISDSIQKSFDSGLMMAGSTFEWSPTSEGVVDYFCMVHPWMVGTILVGEGTAPPPTPQPDTSIDLEVSINEKVYDLDDLVGISVEIDGISGSQKVAIDVTDPRGSTVISRSLTFTSDDEDGEIEFRISEEFKTGTYKVTATTSDGGKIIRDTAHFKVKSQYNSFKITTVESTDQQGNPSNLTAGDIGFIKVNLESNKSIATLVTVNIFDYDLTSIGIGSVKTTLSSGNSEIILSFMIPADAAIGPSDIYVNAFSDWPSNGGIPLTGEVSSVEEIQ